MTVSWQVVIGLVVGGIAFLSVGGFCIILWIARWRHRRALARLSAASDRRLSRYPNGHLTFTDEDFASIPRTRNKLRRPVRMPYGGPPSYANLASSEHIQHPPMARVCSAPTFDGDSDRRYSQQLSWPLPPRLARSSSIPLVKMSPITEAPMLNNRSSKIIEGVRPLRTYRGVEGSINFHGDIMQTVKPEENKSPELVPKALFSDKPRSVSFSHVAHAGTSFPEQRDEKGVTERQRRPSTMPRSISLCNQEPGNAPTQPIPPLPTEVAKSRLLKNAATTGTRSDHEASTYSLLSGGTSIIDAYTSKSFSRAKTDQTSVSLVTPSVSRLATKTMATKQSINTLWEAPRMDRAPSPPQVAKSPEVRPKFEHQRSFRASIQNTLPSSGSSGLSMSLLDQALSTTASTVTLNKDGSPVFSKDRLQPPQDAKKGSILSFPPKSPLRRNPTRVVSDEIKSKRSSASILQAISGNEGSPMHNPIAIRPLSIPTENPFEWNPRMPMKPGKPSTKRDAKVGHKRQNCVRISNLPSANPSPVAFRAMPEEPERPPVDHTQPPPRFSLPPVNDQPNWPIRPPSQVTFDPQIPPSTPTPAPRRASRINVAKAPIFTQLWTPSNSFSLGDLTVDGYSQPLSLPKARAGSNPNRRQKILPDPGNTESFSLFTPQKTRQNHPIVPSPSEKGVPAAAAMEKRNKSRAWLPPPSNRFFPFPSPPHPVRSSSPTGPSASPILSPRGPRALPVSSDSQHHRSSTAKSSKPTLSGHRISDPRQSELCKSIATLRRMNSEISSTCSQISDGTHKYGTNSKCASLILLHEELGESPKDHRKGRGRYLSLGSSPSKSPRRRDSEEGLSPLAKAMQEEVRRVHKNGYGHEHSESCEIIEDLLAGRRGGKVKGPREMPAGDALGVVCTPTKSSRGIHSGNRTRDSVGSMYDERGFLRTS